MSPSVRLDFLRKRFEVYYGDEQFIYALNDPRDGQRRYVGRANNPKRRYGQHIQTARIRRDYLPIVCHHQNIPRQKWDNPLSSKTWIAKLLKSGKKPQLEILEGVTPPVRVSEREMRWISQSINEGHELLNAENSSEGVRKLISEQKVESFLTVDLDKLIKSNFPNELESLLGLRDTGWRRATLIHLLYKTRPKLTIGFHDFR